MNIDKAAGEVLSAPRPITDTLRHLRGGEFLDEASEALQALVRAVDESGKAGSVTIAAATKALTEAFTPGNPLVGPKPIIESAAQAASQEAAIEANTPAMPVAADQFKAGERVMWHYVWGSQEWLRGIYSAAYSNSSNIVCRRPTAAELALHWPETAADPQTL